MEHKRHLKLVRVLPLVGYALFASASALAQSYPCTGSTCGMPSAQGWFVGEIRTFVFGTESADTINNLAAQGWVQCAGQAADRKTFKALFSAVGDTWGSANGQTDFYLPDLRGMFLRGWNNATLPIQPPMLGGDPDATRRLAPRKADVVSPPGQQGHTGDHVGSVELDQAQVMPHTHPVVRYHDTLARAYADSTEKFWAGTEANQSGLPVGQLVRDRGSIADTTQIETRAKNVFVMYAIYVGQPASVIWPKAKGKSAQLIACEAPCKAAQPSAEEK